MKQLNPPASSFTSKQRILQQSKQQKLSQARQYHSEGKLYQSIQQYHKVIFLSQKPQYLMELGEIYQKQLMDMSSAILFYRRALHLKPKTNSHQLKQKLKELTKIKGFQLLEMGGCKNILECAYIEELDNSNGNQTNLNLIEEFKKIYPQFHQKLINTYVKNPNPANTSNGNNNSSIINPNINLSRIKFIPNSPIKSYLQTCLAYLEVNHRQFAFSQIENCQLIQDQNIDIIVLKALLYWSMLQKQKGYKQFWNGYKISKQHPQIIMFLKLIMPKVEELYKEAKYDLIEGNIDKCKLKVMKGLEMHPYHTDMLILKAFLHRSKEEYKQALECLQLANSNLGSQQQKGQNQYQSKAIQLKSQISLTYNQMAIYLYKQQKYSQAIDLFTQGINYKSSDYGLYTNRGDCYKALNQFVKALQDYLCAYEYQKKSSQLNYRISSIYSIRGISLFNSKNYELALKQFQQSLRFTPKNQQFLLSKGKCLIQLNRRQQALQMLNQALSHNSTFNQIKLLLQQIKQPEEKRGPNNRKIIQLSKEKS